MFRYIRCALLLTLVLLWGLAAGNLARAASVYWDVNGATAGLGGTGAWNTSTAFWNTDPTGGGGGTVAVWSNGDQAVFEGTAGTATVSGTVQVDTMTFNTTGYQIAGTTLTLVTTGGVNVGSGLTATTNNVLAGTVGLTKTGQGTLILDGNVNNSITGGLIVNDGTVVIDRDSGTAFGSNQTLTIGDNSGAAGSAKLQITGTGNAHFSNGSPLDIRSDGLFDSGAVTKNTGGVTMANGASITVGTGALTLAATTFNGGGSITTGAGTLTMGNVTYNDASGVATTISGNYLVSVSSVRLYTINDDAGLSQELIFSATLTNTASGGFSKGGAGTMLINGDSPTFTGTIQISGGILEVGPASNALGNSGATISLVNTTGMLQSSDGTDRTVLGAVTIPGSNGTTIQGAGKFHFTNTTPIDLIGGSGGQKNLVINNPETIFEAGFVNSGVSPTRGILKNGTGILTFNGSSTYNGITTINSGMLRLGHANAIPGGLGATGGTNNITIAGGVIGLGATDMLRSLGTGTDQVQFTSTGGFAAYGANRTVNFGGAAATATWGSGSFTPTGQSLILSADDATHKLTLVNPIALGTAVRTVDVRNGTAAVDAELSGILSSGAGGGLTKIGNGTLLISNAGNTYTGATTVSNGTLRVDGSILTSSSVSVASGARLEGIGRLSAINGAGLISPGNSPGILTATTVNPASGTDFAFEMTSYGSPLYTTASASVNDVLHLTGVTPFASALGGTNDVNIYLNMSSLATGSIRGGFYTEDGATDFLSLISGANLNYYVYGDGGGSNNFNGTNYYTLAQYDATELFQNFTIDLSTIAETAAFASGSVDGRVMQLNVTALAVPEPGSAGLLMLGSSLLLWRRKRA